MFGDKSWLTKTICVYNHFVSNLFDILLSTVNAKELNKLWSCEGIGYEWASATRIKISWGLIIYVNILRMFNKKYIYNLLNLIVNICLHMNN